MSVLRERRGETLWLAHLVHRLSGLGLALFLPVHLFLLGQAVGNAEGLDRFLTLTERPLVKVAEFGLVFLLAVHFFGGLRVMALERLGWSAQQKTLAAASLAGAFLVAGLFFLRAL